MKVLVCLVLQAVYVAGVIRKSALVNKLIDVKPVGPLAVKKFIPLTEIPPPNEGHVHKDGRRHFVAPEDCSPAPYAHDVSELRTAYIAGDYYDDRMERTVATVIIPDHIDRKHFEVTTQVPYLTVGHIEGIGFHPSSPPPLNECEKIYQEHINDQYSGMESGEELSEESLEMARVPADALVPEGAPIDVYDDRIVK